MGYFEEVVEIGNDLVVTRIMNWDGKESLVDTGKIGYFSGLRGIEGDEFRVFEIYPDEQGGEW